MAEASILAGLPQAPALWDPYTAPDKAIGRQIERKLLDLRPELHPLVGPLLDSLCNAAIKRARIMPHRFRFERDRQGLAVSPVMIEIEQHQAARKDLVEHWAPALLRGKYLVAAWRRYRWRSLPSTKKAPCGTLRVAGSKGFEPLEGLHPR